MTGASTVAAPSARSRRVLIIEDEVLIAMVLEDMLDLLGHTVVATPASFTEAEAAIAAGGFDLVIADVNLGTDPVYPLADQVLAAGVPMILATRLAPRHLAAALRCRGSYRKALCPARARGSDGPNLLVHGLFPRNRYGTSTP